jgi:hypothetical protein
VNGFAPVHATCGGGLGDGRLAPQEALKIIHPWTVARTIRKSVSTPMDAVKALDSILPPLI